MWYIEVKTTSYPDCRFAATVFLLFLVQEGVPQRNLHFYAEIAWVPLLRSLPRLPTARQMRPSAAGAAVAASAESRLGDTPDP